MRFPDSAAAEMMDLVRWQLSFGVRYPGAPGHQALLEGLGEHILALGLHPIVQRFTVSLAGGRPACTNLVVKVGEGAGSPLLIGSHWDTRLIADREPDPALRRKPIPGANDGGSGTAVLLYLLRYLRELRPRRELQIAFLDAEDVGSIDGNDFSMGARFLASHPLGEPPAEAIALDMVGGRGMVLDRDAHAKRHPPSLELTRRLFGLGVEAGLAPFVAVKPDQWKYIVSDHHPFYRRGIPAAILIDIDYPPWHTQGDLPEAMDGESLAATLRVVATYIERFAA
jgi:glutaminyl-peptide cyclotransferase